MIQENIICEALTTERNGIMWSDLFGDIEEQLETTKVYIKLIKEKNHLLENENRENVKKTFTLGYGKR